MTYGYENLKLEKGMYAQSGKSFSKVLESMDPSENYRGTALEGLDAFQRQLKRFDIHVKGAGSDMVEKFFHTTDSAVLFPEFVSRVVRQGMEEESILPAITAAVTIKRIFLSDISPSPFSIPASGRRFRAVIAKPVRFPKPGQGRPPCFFLQAVL